MASLVRALSGIEPPCFLIASMASFVASSSSALPSIAAPASTMSWSRASSIASSVASAAAAASLRPSVAQARAFACAIRALSGQRCAA